jgi:hypothetical protein
VSSPAPYHLIKMTHTMEENEQSSSVWSERVLGPCLTISTLVLLATIVVALFWFPLIRTSADEEVNYNEGWNSYRQEQVANGVPLYSAPPDHLTGGTGYPPLSFHIIGWIAANGNFNVVGRWVSWLGLVGTGILIALIVRRAGATVSVASLCFLLYEVGVALLLPSRLGMNDPQLLGELFATAGLFLYVVAGKRYKWLWLSAVLFCIAGFTKQNLIAFPAVVAIDLLIISRKAFMVWAAAMIASASVLTGIVLRIDGPYFAQHLLFTRAYSYRAGWHDVIHVYLVTLQGPLFLAVMWTICAFRPRRLFVLAFLVAHAMAFWMAGADGVDLNICFNALAAALILCGVALADLTNSRRPLSASPPNPVLRAALMAALLFSVMMHVPGQLQDSYDANKLLRSREGEFRSAVQLLRSRPGPSLCESFLLCHTAGKPIEFDPLFVQDQTRIGRLSQAEISELIRSRHFQTIQITVTPQEANERQIPVKARPRFTRASIDEMLQNYEPALCTSKMFVYVPRPVPSERGGERQNISTTAADLQRDR